MPNVLEKTLEINMLIDFYGNLLTKKQLTYVEQYYFDDLSLAEIAESFQVSRNAIFDNLKRTVKQLYNYEEKLGLVNKYRKRRTLMKQLKAQCDDRTEIDTLLKELESIDLK